MSNSIDPINQVFGRLTVTSFSHKKYNKPFFNCTCDCGGTTTVDIYKLLTGHTRSCGCLLRKHGGSNTPTYCSWSSMKNRCYNTEGEDFQNYGGRGITVCDSWRNSFQQFLNDMGTKPDGLTIDRINNGGNYEPSNCKWSSKKEQSRNRRSCRHITHNGITLTMAEWSKKLGFGKTIIWHRLYSLGWSEEKALTTPLRAMKKRC